MKPDFWSQFIAGLTRPSAGAVALAAAINVLLFGGLAIGLDASSFRSDLAWNLAENALDSDAYSTIEAQRMSLRESARPVVVVLGASATMNSVDGVLLDATLGQSQGHDIYMKSSISCAMIRRMYVAP